MKQTVRRQTFDQERALYHLQDAWVEDCIFAGPADGESALKECRNVTVTNCSFSLRYPLWHADGFQLSHSTLEDKTRAPIWYSRNGRIQHSAIYGVKCLRECQNISILDTEVVSPEFGWKCHNIEITDSRMESEYFLLECQGLKAVGLQMKGKYSFQYAQNLRIERSKLDTKDAFWHSKHVTVIDSEIKGEYLAWFSDGLTLVNCRISGTQPFCYCTNLKLINCTMEGTDLAFEYSDVQAEVRGHILSVKNPRSGVITADSVGEIIRQEPIMECTGQVRLRETTDRCAGESWGLPSGCLQETTGQGEPI